MITEFRVCSSLEKIFSFSPLPAEHSELSLMKNERGGLQIAVKTDSDEEIALSVKSDVPFTVFEEKEIYSGLALYETEEKCTVINGAKSGYYPDLLVPSDGNVFVKADANAVFWIEFTGTVPGKDRAEFRVEADGEKRCAYADITVSETELPEQKIIHTNWFHSDCLSVYYNVEVFSEEWWRITENYIRNAASHGVNMLLTPVFTPALDTKEGGERPTVQLCDVYRKDGAYSFGAEKLDRWIDICLDAGIKYFEISHFFTQWGAKHAPKIMAETENGVERIFGWETDSTSEEYTEFLKAFGAFLSGYTDARGITDRCFVHCSDEPSLEAIELYRKTSSVLRDYFPKFRHIDALSDYDFYKEGLIDVPVPSENAIEKFAGKVPQLWTYYCCGQFRDEVPNRFFCFPSVKNRMLGVLLYKYNCEGFLQWGYNFWFSQLSDHPIDPFKVTDADGAFPSGDAFIVYPGDNGEPLSSLRQKVFYDGFEDHAVLCALEKKTSREEVLKLIKETLGDISFTDYPIDNEVFLEFAKKIRQ